MGETLLIFVRVFTIKAKYRRVYIIDKKNCYLLITLKIFIT